jgi:hypothetical protein
VPIAQLGQVNISALQVPQALVQIVPPQYLFGGVSTNIGGFVGTASWGPVGVPTVFGNYSQYASQFGPTINRLNDIGAHVILAQQQGAQYFTGVRVTDGTDVAATGQIQNNYATGTVTFVSNPVAATTITIGGTVVTFVASGAVGLQVNIGGTLALTLTALQTVLAASVDANLVKAAYAVSATVLTITYATRGLVGNSFTIATNVTGATASAATLLNGGVSLVATALYTGSLGNGIKLTLQPGSKAGTYRVVISCPGLPTEVFDNIAAGLTGNAIWVGIAAAINSGASGIRPASNLIILTAQSVGIAPLAASTTYTFASGTDGVTTITGLLMIGQDVVPRTGMYALRGTNIARFDLCDLSDLTLVLTQNSFALDIGAEAICVSPMSDTITNAAIELGNQGIDSYAVKVIFGDWVVWPDTINQIPQRVTSPQAIAMGIRGNLSPQNSLLNKPIYGIAGTQSSVLNKRYSYADLQALATARMDVIALDPTLTNNFIFRLGINTSSNQVIYDDAYTDVTNFLAKSLVIVASQYVGQTQTADERRRARISLQGFMAFAQQNGIIGTADNTQAYQVTLDNTNNTQISVALGFQYAYVKAIYLGIVRFFIVNLEGGASVTISNTLISNSTPALGVGVA